MFVRLIVILTTIHFMSPPTGDKPGVLRAGTWSYRSPKTILGAGTDTTITFRLMREGMFDDDRTFAGWTITYTRIRYYSRGGHRDPEVTTAGPYRVEVDEAESILAIHGEDVRPSEHTFAFSEDGSTLTMPAFVEVEPGRFLFVNYGERGGQRYEMTCEHDPVKIPVGSCQIQDVRGGRGFYSYEEAPRSLQWSDDKSARYLRLLERVEDGGYLIERGRLIWDQWGSPRYERLLSTGEKGSHRTKIKLWHAEAAVR